MDQAYFISSPFSGEPIALAAAQATMTALERKNFDNLIYYGKRFIDKFNSYHPRIQIKGYGSRGQFDVSTTTAALFMQEMVRSGYFFGKAFFYNFAHLAENVDGLVFPCMEEVVFRIKSGAIPLEGIAPKEAFKS